MPRTTVPPWVHAIGDYGSYPGSVRTCCPHVPDYGMRRLGFHLFSEQHAALSRALAGGCDNLLIAGLCQHTTILGKARRTLVSSVVLRLQAEYEDGESCQGKAEPDRMARSIILGNWWNRTHQSRESQTLISRHVPFASLYFLESSIFTPADLIDRPALARKNSGRRLIAHLSRDCMYPWRLQLWDKIVAALPEGEAFALGQCNGIDGLATVDTSRLVRDEGPSQADPTHRNPWVRLFGRQHDGGFANGTFVTYHDEAALLYRDYRFVFVAENHALAPGYITEKLILAFLGGGVPVFAGHPSVLHIFNEAAFVYIANISRPEAALRELTRLAANATAYKQMLQQPILSTAQACEFFSWHSSLHRLCAERGLETVRDRVIKDVATLCQPAVPPPAKMAEASPSPPVSAVPSASEVPPLLHRVWVGEACPPVQDLVSLLAAVLMLRPREMNYHVTSLAWLAQGWEAAWRARPGCGPFAFGYRQCLAALGVRIRPTNLSRGGSSFADAVARLGGGLSRDTLDAKLRRGEIKLQHVSDLLRLHALQSEGGVYLDSDVFVLRPYFAAHRRSDFTIGVDAREDIISVEHLPRLNNGAMMARPNSAFGRAWWEALGRSWDGPPP